MSKIFDALENAQKEGIVGSIPVEPQSPPSPPFQLPSQPDLPNVVDIDMELEMVTLYQTIMASLPDINHPSILFIGTRANEGTSTIARELAKMVSLRMEKTVLFIDFEGNRPKEHIYTNLKPEKTVDEVVNTGDSMEKALCRVEESSLYVMPVFQRTSVTSKALDPVKGSGFWEPLKERFDLIIVDSPPATLFPGAPAIAAQVDGVILVVEAEKTRWQVALSIKDRLIKGGGTILGIVFNKRKYYIPQYVYKYL